MAQQKQCYESVPHKPHTWFGPGENKGANLVEYQCPGVR